jgi:hypothetical protein
MALAAQVEPVSVQVPDEVSTNDAEEIVDS